MFAIPISTVIGAPISGLILNMEGIGGLRVAWQWIFLIEAVPALVVMTLAVLYYLTDRPAQASAAAQRAQMAGNLDAERATRESHFRMTWVQSMLAPRVIALGFVYMALNLSRNMA